MRCSAVAALLFLVASTQAANLLAPNRQYVYKTVTTSATGTMDYSPHAAALAILMDVTIQTSGNNMNIKIDNVKAGKYVGAMDPKNPPREKINFQSMPDRSVEFSVEGDPNTGKVQSLRYPADYPIEMKNVIRALASQLQLQVNPATIATGEQGSYRAMEESVHGECNVLYTVTPDSVYKTVSHVKDCKNRAFRLIDDWRGHRCDIDWHHPESFDPTEGIISNGNSYYKLAPDTGDHMKITQMTTTGSVVGHMFEEEGVSHITYVNMTSVLVDVGSSPGDISVSGGEVTSTLRFMFSDEDYKWDKERNLKETEPFFSSGLYFTDSQQVGIAAVKKGIANQKGLLDTLDIDKASIAKLHRQGINSLMPVMFMLNYDSLKSLADELLGGSNTFHSNIFGELLSQTGTTASALLVKDLVMSQRFDNSRDATRVLTGVPFHIRRPNKQLVEEYEKLLDFANSASEGLKMAIPLTFGHLVRMTCERAGNHAMSEESKKCFASLGKKYVDKFFGMYQSASTRAEKKLYLAAITNIRFGGQSDKLLSVIKDAEVSDELRNDAFWASAWDMMTNPKHKGQFLTLLADTSNPYELRIYAAIMLMSSKPSTTDLATVVSIIKREQNYELINFMFTLFEKKANSINPCDRDTKKKVAFFLKFMKQYSKYETDWGFGVSKTYSRQFEKKKYGYGGEYNFYTIGSESSTTPLMIGASLGTTMFKSYRTDFLGGYFRIEGMAKGLIRKFKKMDPATWKTSDLTDILTSNMGIREHPDQPVRIGVTIMLKGTIVIQRSYDESSADKKGKVGSFMKKLTELGNEYEINHQRMLTGASGLYEQPNEIGLATGYITSLASLVDFQAKVERGSHRGLLYRKVKYDAHVFTHGTTIMMSRTLRGTSIGVKQDRVYHLHIPRKMLMGINPVKTPKEIKISLERPEYDHPWMFMMHSQTEVMARDNTLDGKLADFSKTCPTCKQSVVISNGEDAVSNRVIMDKDRELFGYSARAQYFDCEMNVARGNVVARGIGAFMPYNKHPKTAWTSLSMGLRQIRAFFLYFPRAEKCGVIVRLSRSKVNPVKDVDITISVKKEDNGQRLFFKGQEYTIVTLLKLKGEFTRSWRLAVKYKYKPGYLQNEFKMIYNRNKIPQLNMPAYSVCLNYENKYPDFADEMLEVDMNEDMKMTGKANLKYGEGKTCDSNQGEINVKFDFSTTADARAALQKKFYYKQCMDEKNSDAWLAIQGSNRLPTTEACYRTAWDATYARRYKYNIEFTKLTDRMKSIVSGVRSLIQTGLLPYWDMDPEAMDGDITDVGPFMNVVMEFKNGDSLADLSMQTSQGTTKFSDYPLKLNWTKRLRNLKFTKTIMRLMKYRILNPCGVTKDTIRTNDNVTYAYEADSCWTLMSAHCGANPSYAVFTKASGGSKPLQLMAYIGGHKVEIDANSDTVKINGDTKSIAKGANFVHKVNDVEIFTLYRWGETYNINSFLRVWAVFDGNFVNVVPAPSVKGAHCGMCGNYNRNKYDEMTGKDGTTQLATAADMVNEWKWKC